MISVDSKVKDTVATAIFIIQVNNVKQLERVIKKLSKVKNIDLVERTHQ